MKVKFLLKYIVGFILFVSIYIFILSFTIKITIFNEEHLLKKLDDNNYYQLLYKKTNEEMSYYIIQSGLEEEVIKDIIAIDMIESDVKKVINSIYNKEKLELDTSLIQEKLEANIDSYLLRQNIKVEDTKDLEMFINSIIRIYENKVSFSNYVGFLRNYLFIYSNKINSLLIISGTFIFTSYIYLVSVLNNKKLNAIFMTCGLSLLLTIFVIKDNIDISNIVFYSNEVSLIIRSILIDILTRLRLVAYILLIFSIILVVFKGFSILKSNNSN